MAVEIERKYLVKDLSFKKLSTGVLYKQGYLSEDSNNTVRIRIIGTKGLLTIKGPTIGISRAEYEYEIPIADAEEMMESMCLKPVIQKYRYTFKYKGFTWEVDEFLQENNGLIVAEIELKDENHIFTKPDFIGDEVTDDHRYRNSYLALHPYKTW
ncbi:MAG TPA: CYTH domain-containing protein [Thermoclostridium sp.]|nr:CYTH domain-containing protein [Thermoclostridium sp.]